MTKVPQTRDELVGHLREQIEFLRTSAELFDGGQRAEAKRLATAIRILLHDTAKSRSLLSQLGVKEKIRYTDTSHAPLPPGAIRLDFGLAVARTEFGPGGRTEYAAPLGDIAGSDRVRPPQSFEVWWTSTVLKDNARNEFSREALVLGLAHLDGGAHVDPLLREAYAALTRSNSLGWTFYDEGGNVLLAESPVLTNVRQIAYEVDDTIARELPDLLRT